MFQIQVTVPKLSQPVAGWLLKTPEKLESPTEPLVFQPLVSSWRSDVVNDSSTQQWLLDIQNHPEVEEENEFEIISPTQRTYSGNCFLLINLWFPWNSIR